MRPGEANNRLAQKLEREGRLVWRWPAFRIELPENAEVVEAQLADLTGVDMVISIYLPFLGLRDIDVAKALMEIKAQHPEKPIVGVFMTKNEFFSTISDMDVNIPFFQFAEEAVDGLARLNMQRKWLARPEGKTPVFDVARDKVDALFAAARSEGRAELTTRESLDVLDAYGVRVCKAGFARTEDEAVAIAESIGWPVVMKMTSKTTSHKTDVGGVRVNLGSAEELRANYQDLVAKLKEKGLLEGLEGVIIQEMVKSSRELVCGVACDPQYGPMVMFGLGGVFVEVMKDVSFSLAPLTDQDAHDLIRSVKAFKLLEGARGTKPADIAKVEEIVLRLSQLVTDYPEVIELDINPLMISDKTGEAIAVDGRIKIKL